MEIKLNNTLLSISEMPLIAYNYTLDQWEDVIFKMESLDGLSPIMDSTELLMESANDRIQIVVDTMCFTDDTLVIKPKYCTLL